MSTSLQSIQERIKEAKQNLKGSVAAPTGRVIGVKGKRFAFPSGQSTEGPIEVVILDHRNFNRYYTAAYNPNVLQPPSCWALGSEIETMGPAEGFVNAQSLICKTCTQNKWGSAPSGGKGKACRNTVRLAVMAPDAKPDDEPMLISISPTGLTPWATLINGFDSLDIHPTQVVTEISFKGDVAYPSLLFKSLRSHDNLETAWLLRDKAQAMLDAEPSAND